MARDPFSLGAPTLQAQYYYAATPSNTDDLPVAGPLLIAVGGDIAIVRMDGTSVTLTVPAGYFMGVVKQLKSTGTTATGFTVMV